MKTKAVIFDLDGTLLNTIEDLSDSMNRVLEENSFSLHNMDKYYSFVGNGARKLVERALPENKRDKKSLDKFLERYREVYSNNWNKKTKKYNGIDQLLYGLKALGITMAILSNKPHSDLVKCVSHYFDDSYFVAVEGQKEHIPHKPAPDGAIAIAENLNVSPESCMFIGDSSVDMKTAKAASMTAVGVSWGFRTSEELVDNGADHIIDEPHELLALL